jgi:tRNA pseudouridine38-40 synthase
MMGALLEVGRGRMTADDIDRLYELKDRSKSGPTAPPEGLCMVRVEHDEGWRIGNP